MAIRLTLLALVAASSLVPGAASNAQTLGGTDVPIDLSDPSNAGSKSIAVAANGDMYAATSYRLTPTSRDRINIRRSVDGGESWSPFSLWATSNTDFTSPVLMIAEGTVDRLYFAHLRDRDGFDPELRVSFTELGATPLAWSDRVVLAEAGLYGDVSLISDASEYNLFYLYIAFTHSPLFGPKDAYFSSSQDRGSSWDTPSVLGFAGSALFHNIQLAFGGDVLHVVWDLQTAGGSNPETVILHRRNTGYGAPSGWSGTDLVGTSLLDGFHDRWPSIAAGPSGEVVVAFGRNSGALPVEKTVVRVSTDGGVTWPASNQREILDVGAPGLITLPGGSYALSGAQVSTGRAGIGSHGSGGPLDGWTFSTVRDGASLAPIPFEAPLISNPAHSDQVGVVFNSWTGGRFGLHFDAEWRTDTDGDGHPDGSDNCPTVANAAQQDVDLDAVGDACDNCVAEWNPRQGALFVPANLWATVTGDQRDDDADGIGNRCDGKFPGVGGSVISGLDMNELLGSLGAFRSDDTCGSSGTAPCAVFDVDESGTVISGLDLSRFLNSMLGQSQAGVACPSCPLVCAGDNCP